MLNGRMMPDASMRAHLRKSPHGAAMRAKKRAVVSVNEDDIDLRAQRGQVHLEPAGAAKVGAQLLPRRAQPHRGEQPLLGDAAEGDAQVLAVFEEADGGRGAVEERADDVALGNGT